MKLGAEPKKVAILAVLLVVAAYFLYTNVISPDYGPPPGTQAASAAPASTPAETAPPPAAIPPPPAAPRASRPKKSAVVTQYNPTLVPKRPEDRPDPMKVDPTLRLDLLADLQDVTVSGGNRSLFDFSQPPAPKTPEPKILPPPIANIVRPAAPPAPVKPTKPPPPPIPLKYYGFVNDGAGRRAMFLNGDDIFIAAEGETVQARYKIVRVGLTSAVVEDTQNQHQQTLQLEQPSAAG